MAVGRIDVVLSANSQSFIDGMTRSQAAAEATAVKFSDVSARVANGSRNMTEGAFRVGEFFGKMSSQVNNAARSFEAVTGSSNSTLTGILGMTEGLQQMSESVGTASALFNVFTQVTGVGLIKLSALFPAMGAKIAAVAGPVGIIVGAIAALGYVVYTNFESISSGARVVTNAFIRMYNNFMPLRIAAELVYQTFNVTFTFIRNAVEVTMESFRGLGRVISNVANGEIGEIGETIKNTLSNIKVIVTTNKVALANDISDSIKRVSGEIKLKELSASEWENKISSPIRKFIGLQKPTELSIEPKIKDAKGANIKVGADTKPAEDSLAQFIAKIDFSPLQVPIDIPATIRLNTDGLNDRVLTSNIDTIIAKAKAQFETIDGQFRLTGDTAGRLQSQIQATTRALEELGNTGVGQSDVRVAELTNRLAGLGNQLSILRGDSKNAAEEIGGNMIALAEGINAGAQALIGDTLTAVGEGIANVLTGTASAGDVVKSVATAAFSTLGGIMVNLGKTVIAGGTAIEALKRSLASFSGIGAIAAGVGLIALGTILKSTVSSTGTKAFARGGAVSGPMTAIVGDNPNAAFDNEVIQPESKLRKLMAEVLAKSQNGGLGELNLNLRGNLGHRQMALAVQSGNYYQNRVR